jgi:hypothetical protein
LISQKKVGVVSIISGLSTSLRQRGTAAPHLRLLSQQTLKEHVFAFDSSHGVQGRKPQPFPALTVFLFMLNEHKAQNASFDGFSKSSDVGSRLTVLNYAIKVGRIN